MAWTYTPAIPKAVKAKPFIGLGHFMSGSHAVQLYSFNLRGYIVK